MATMEASTATAAMEAMEAKAVNRIVTALPRLFEQADIDPRRRGETLSIQEFIRLGKAYAKLISSKMPS